MFVGRLKLLLRYIKCLLVVSIFTLPHQFFCWLSQNIYSATSNFSDSEKFARTVSIFCSTGHNAEWRRQAVLTTNDKESCSKSAESLETDIRNEYHHHCCVEFSTCPHHELHPWVTVQPPLTPRGGGGGERGRGRGREGCRAGIMNLRMTKKLFDSDKIFKWCRINCIYTCVYSILHTVHL